MFKREFNREISTTTVKRLLKFWNWSWKVPSFVQINKYTVENMNYYGYFLLFLKGVAPQRLKFIDESHFVSKNLRSTRVWGMKNQRVWLTADDLHQKRASITLMTSLCHHIPVYFNWRVNSNSGKDFLYFVASCIANGYLNQGDCLILDNASVHRDSNTIFDLIELLAHYNIELVYLPTYSPELNPCELVFQYIKEKIRSLNPDVDIFDRLIHAVANLNQDMMARFYSHCCDISLVEERIRSGCI